MMFSAYDTATGLISYHVAVSSPSMLTHSEGVGFVPGKHDARNRKVDLTTGEVVPHQPDAPPDTELATHSWHEDSEVWLSSPTLKARQLEVWRQVKAEREAAKSAPLTYLDRLIDVHPEGRKALATKTLFALANANFTVDWITADNQSVTLTQQKFLRLVATLDYRDQQQHTYSQKVRAEVMASDSPETVKWSFDNA